MPISPTPSILTYPSAEVALAGIDTPLGSLSVIAPDASQVGVIITASLGTLAAATFPGATISGGGTDSLWIAGSAADVNAKLATLIYSAPLAGSDTLSIRLVDASGETAGPVTIPLSVVPLTPPPGLADPVVTISGGTLALEERQIDGITLNLHDADTGAGAATAILVDTTLGANTTLDVTAFGAATPAPRVAVARQVQLDGVTNFNAGPALVTLAQGALLTNDGTIAFDGSSAQFTGAGALQNDGILAVSASSGPTIDTALTGSGVLSIAAGSTLTLGAPVSASQTIDFEDNSGVLALTDPQDMQATIAGFVPGDRIQLGEVTVDAADYSASATGGTLTLFDGAQLIASLNFAGPHQLSDFVVSVATDSAPDGGAISTLTVLASTVVATGASAVGAELYRFFDTTNGTQLLTADPAERDAVMATRPDLKFEGAAMGAVAAPADDPAATPVYRFFDIADGTHFLTANEAEKNALLATRPDLVFEPSSTIWEDATQQPGDVPVFRFFDTATGTHFYTASAAERASILTTRSDFTAEGIAFYAPAQ